MTLLTAGLARDLLERAIAHDSKPALTEDDVDLLMEIGVASVDDEDGEPRYSGASLNRAAAVGWNWKAGRTADQYTLGGGSGRVLNRKEWHDHCRQRAEAYATGAAAVYDVGLGQSVRPGSPFLTSYQAVTETHLPRTANDIGAINV